MKGAYYNEIEPFAADWLRRLIARGLIAPGDVDTRSIVDVRPNDLRSYTQCHFFAGIGGWSYALRSAGWDDDRPVWTGSCPCQPFSSAGKQKGFDDARHLWPVWRELIRECDPSVVFGEQVASATEWLGLVRSDLEAMGRAVGAMPIQAASAGADHLRDRYWFVAYADSARPQGRGLLPERAGERLAWPDGVADAEPCSKRCRDLGCFGMCGDVADAERCGHQSVEGQSRIHEQEVRNVTLQEPCPDSNGHEWVIGADGKSRRVKPGLRLLAHGVPGRVGKLRGFGNAIDPRPAAAFIEAAIGALSLTPHDAKGGAA